MTDVSEPVGTPSTLASGGRGVPDGMDPNSGQERVGFFTDTSVCIGCKACEVACKEWNAIPEDGMSLTGMSYDNTEALGASTWRHVAFVERCSAGSRRARSRRARASPGAPPRRRRWRAAAAATSAG
jgi:formate dehydrogenase iron-sulfur subunit